MRLELDVTLDPDTRVIEAAALLDGFSEFFLHRALTIRTEAPGDLVASQTVCPFLDEDATAWTVAPAHEGPVRISYRGALPADLAEGTNLIEADRLELSLYSAWFPVPADLGAFAWTLRLHLPDGWTAVSNGRAVPGGFESDEAATTGDVVVAASPTVLVEEVDGLARVVQVGRGSSLAASVGALSRSALERLGSAYGVLDVVDPMTIVFTNRGGYAYSRLPAIFLAGAGTGDASRDLHTVLHELGHLWWSVAPADGVEDWLNEALAEYSALWLSRELLGAGFAARLLDGYRDVAQRAASPAVVEMGADQEQSFYANKYARGALLFDHLGKALGWERCTAVLSAWHGQWAATGGATTQSLLDVIGQEDADAMEAVRRCITTESWDGTWHV